MPHNARGKAFSSSETGVPHGCVTEASKFPYTSFSSSLANNVIFPCESPGRLFGISIDASPASSVFPSPNFNGLNNLFTKTPRSVSGTAVSVPVLRSISFTFTVNSESSFKGVISSLALFTDTNSSADSI